MSRQYLVDAALKLTLALPNGAATTTSTGLDLGDSSGDMRADVEVRLSLPALGVTPLADAKTMKIQVLGSANSDLSSPTILADQVLIQTGAGGVGAAAIATRYKPASNCPRYIFFKATGSASGDASASVLTAQLVF